MKTLPFGVAVSTRVVLAGYEAEHPAPPATPEVMTQLMTGVRPL